MDGAAVALGVAEVADQAARKKGDAVAGRLGYLSVEQWSATIAAAHRAFPVLYGEIISSLPNSLNAPPPQLPRRGAEAAVEFFLNG